MKNILKFITSLICYIAFIPCTIALTIAFTWYLLPAVQSTYLGSYVGNFIGVDNMLLFAVVAAFLSLMFLVVGKIFTVFKGSKILNFYTHLLTWILALVLIAEAGYAFVASKIISTSTIRLNLIRKIGIIACNVIMLLYSMAAPKFRTLINRRIQAYDTAKELNVKGRSSVIWVQLLKCVDFMCPEMLLLVSLCFAFSWEIAIYFMFIIGAFMFPIFGNIVCDYRAKKEAVRKEIEKQDAQVNATAEAVADILQQRGEA